MIYIKAAGVTLLGVAVLVAGGMIFGPAVLLALIMVGAIYGAVWHWLDDQAAQKEHEAQMLAAWNANVRMGDKLYEDFKRDRDHERRKAS